MELKRVVVTGLGAVTPVGNSPEETWQNLVAGKSGAAPITQFDTTNFKTKFACEVKNLNVCDYLDRKEVRKMDRYTQLAMISAIQGVKDSGLDLETVDKSRIGVVTAWASAVSTRSRRRWSTTVSTSRLVRSSILSSSRR